jgi:hypothetical protein
VRKKRIKCVALVNVSCGDSILVESILRENYQQKGFHAAKTHKRHQPDRNPAMQRALLRRELISNVGLRPSSIQNDDSGLPHPPPPHVRLLMRQSDRSGRWSLALFTSRRRWRRDTRDDRNEAPRVITLLGGAAGPSVLLLGKVAHARS